MSRTKYKVNVKCVHSFLERMQAPIFHVSSSALFVIKSDLFFNLFYINLLWIPHCIHPYAFRQRCNMFRHPGSFHKFPDIFFQKRHLDTLNSVKHKEKPILQKTLLVLFQFFNTNNWFSTQNLLLIYLTKSVVFWSSWSEASFFNLIFLHFLQSHKHPEDKFYINPYIYCVVIPKSIAWSDNIS